MAATTIKRIGYGQVEPNHLSGIVTGQIYAQLPAKGNTAAANQPSNAIAQLEQGQFAKYDYANGEVNLTGEGEWMLVFNEEKLYDPMESLSDYAMIRDNYMNGHMIPRLCKTNIGDIYTTNTVAETTLQATDILTVNTDGFLEIGATTDPAPLFEVAKVTTMPDGQKAVKIRRIA